MDAQTGGLAMAYSMEFRRAVARAHEECGSSKEVAEQFGCSESWVRRLVQRLREDGTLAPRPIKLPDNHKLHQKELDQLRQLIQEKPDMTLGELAAALGNKVSIPTVWRATKRLGMSFKKSPSTPANKRGRMSPKRGDNGSGGSRTSA